MIVTLVPCTKAGVGVPVPPLATGNTPVTPVDKGRPVALVSVPLEGVPKAGVTSVGLLDNTALPVPVEVVTPVPPLVTGSAAPRVKALKCVTASITFTPFTYKCISAPLGTVMPVPAAVFTVMLWPPDVLLWTRYCFSIVGTTRLRVAVKLPVDVALRTKARAVCRAGPSRSVRSIVRLASEVKIGFPKPVIACSMAVPMLVLVVLPQVFDCSPLPISSNFRFEKVLAMGKIPCALLLCHKTTLCGNKVSG